VIGFSGCELCVIGPLWGRFQSDPTAFRSQLQLHGDAHSVTEKRQAVLCPRVRERRRGIQPRRNCSSLPRR